MKKGTVQTILAIIITIIMTIIIIGIIGYVSMKRSIQARDYTRNTNLKMIESVLSFYHEDYGEYPENLEAPTIEKSFRDGKTPTDRLDGQVIDGCTFAYQYQRINKNEYVLSSCLEDGTEKAKNDGGVDNKRYEIRRKAEPKGNILNPISQLSKAQSKARDAQRISNIQLLRTVLETYYLDYGEYPESLKSLELSEYLRDGKLPEDPMEGQKGDHCTFTFDYKVNEHKTEYKLKACLENQQKAKSNGGTNDYIYETGNF